MKVVLFKKNNVAQNENYILSWNSKIEVRNLKVEIIDLEQDIISTSN